MMNKKPSFVNLALHFIGFFFCIVPPSIATLSYFPLWTEGGAERSVAGGCALLLVLCAYPLFKLVRRAIFSFASYFLWLFLFLVFLTLSKIADQMTVISLVGFIGNLIGAVCFNVAKRIQNEKR